MNSEAINDADDGERTQRRLEMIAGALGAVLTLGVLGVLAYDGLSRGGRPAALVIEPGDTHVAAGGYLVEFEVRNTGDETAATLVVEGVLRRRGEIVDIRETTFDYVSPRATQSGGMVFSVDPSQVEHEIELRARSWVEP